MRSGRAEIGLHQLAHCAAGVLLCTAQALLPLVLARTAAAGGQVSQDFVHVEGKLSSISGASLYIDQGRDAHVEVGDRVLLYPPGVSSVEAIVRAVSKSSARIELLPGSPNVVSGTRIEVFVPKERLAAPAVPPVVPPAPAASNPPVKPLGDAAQAPPPKPPPVHPPWTHPPESWSSEHPLLAPAFGQSPEERERTLHGRAWIDLHQTTDSIGGTKRYFLGRVGSSVLVENPFGDGGELAVDAEILQRSNSYSDAPSDTQTDFVLQHLSYVHGGTQDEPTRWEFGRFLAHEFPELGLIDGIEWTRRTEGGSRFGVNAGGLPEPFPDMNAFRDLGVAVFGRLVSDPSERWMVGGALQSTWHEGQQDRNLVVLEGEWRPSRDFSWRNVAWVDYYDSQDTLKSPGFELTEFSTSVRWRFTPGWGLSTSASRRRYPELLREEFASVAPALIQDGVLDRAAFSVWHDLSPRTRLDARLDGWRDQDDSGNSAELGVSWRDLLYEHGTLGLSVFHVDGSFSQGDGLRANASRSWESVFGSLSYEYTSYDQKNFNGDQATLAHHALYGSLDLPLGDHWDLSLQADDRFGDEQDAWSVGMMLQVRF